MTKRNVIITGANSGIGKAATKKFAAEGHFVTMACRSMEKGYIARKEVIDYSGSDRVEVMKLDISSFRSIHRFCTEYREKHKALDVLIHNAASFNHGEKQYQFSEDNLEITFATNVFGPYLMTDMLYDMLAQSDAPRILNACSTNIKHFFDPQRSIDFDNLQGEQSDSHPYNVYKLYGDSKMALLMLTFRWAEIFKKDEINVNAVMINNIRQEWQSLKKVKSWYRPVGILQNLFAYPTSMMADVYYHICMSNEFRNVTGKLINHRKEIVSRTNLHDDTGFLSVFNEIRKGETYPAYADNTDIQEKVWTLCNEVINKHDLLLKQKV